MQTSQLKSEMEDRHLVQIMVLAQERAHRMLRSDLADDVVQDVVLECLLKMRQGQWVEPTSLSRFVHQMVRRRSVDAHRRAMRRGQRDAVHVRELGTSHPWMDPTAGVEEYELAVIHASAMNRLSDGCRRAFVMVRENELPYQVVADRLGVAPTTICVHVVRAQRQLRAHLLEAGIAPPRRKSQKRTAKKVRA